MVEQLWTMSGMIRDLEATGQHIPVEEQALNVIQALPDADLWWSFSLVMAYNDNIKTFEAISKHLEMEDERQKSLPLLMWHSLPGKQA